MPGAERASQEALVVKNLPAKAGDMGSIPGSGRCPGGGHGHPLQYSCLESPIQSTGSHRVGHNRSDLACMHTRSRTQVQLTPRPTVTFPSLPQASAVVMSPRGSREMPVFPIARDTRLAEKSFTVMPSLESLPSASG